jgi:hypothetical protein
VGQQSGNRGRSQRGTGCHPQAAALQPRSRAAPDRGERERFDLALTTAQHDRGDLMISRPDHLLLSQLTVANQAIAKYIFRVLDTETGSIEFTTPLHEVEDDLGEQLIGLGRALKRAQARRERPDVIDVGEPPTC